MIVSMSDFRLAFVLGAAVCYLCHIFHLEGLLKHLESLFHPLIIQEQ